MDLAINNPRETQGSWWASEVERLRSVRIKSSQQTDQSMQNVSAHKKVFKSVNRVIGLVGAVVAPPKSTKPIKKNQFPQFRANFHRE